MADPTARFVLTATDQTRAAFTSVATNMQRLDRAANAVKRTLGAFGLVIGARVFANYVSGALEANKLTEEQAKVLGGAKREMEALNAEIQSLVRELATGLAPALEQAAAGWRKFLFPTEKESAQKRIGELNELIQETRRSLESMERSGATSSPLYQRRNKELAEYRQELERVWEQLKRVSSADPQVEMTFKRIGSAFERANSLVGGKLRTPTIELDELPEDGLVDAVLGINKKTGRTAERMSLDDLIKPFPAAEVRAMFAPVRQGFEELQSVLRSGLHNAFSDFLVDGERNFRSFLQRLAADLATSALFKGLGTLFGGFGGNPIAKFLGGVFGGGRANGGPVAAGTVYRVHEGEAFFAPGRGGQVGSAEGGMVYAPVTNIDARGADSSMLKQLPEILERNNRKQRAEIADLMRRGRFP